ncbi:MAG: hypothetical protein LBG95_02425 [Treponema sp.]|jgi:hypothetical protein|nr:hypothetical protein [Treponema sp.]
MKKRTAFLTAITLLTAALRAADFGVLLDQSAGVGGVEDPAFNYETSFIPRFSALLGDSGDLYLSAGLTFGYDDGAYFVPELLRTELTWRSGDGAKITTGRMRYAAPFSAVAEGLFDGLQFSYNASWGSFNAGAWYTGLLYKKKANIIMTGEDSMSYYDGLDYENFAATCFASKRQIMALGWEHPALLELLRTKVGIIAQTDLNGNDNYLHSQYITARIGIPVSQLMFTLGGALEFAENADDFGIGFAGELDASWNLPTAFSSRLSFVWYYSSGHAEDSSVTAFTPITSKFSGYILQANPSAISTLSLNYTARPRQNTSLSVASTYFIRTDLGTFVNYPLDIGNSDGYCLGNEFFVNLTWSPASDLQANLGGGIFVPAMGNAAPGRKPQLRVELRAIFTLY